MKIQYLVILTLAAEALLFFALGIHYMGLAYLFFTGLSLLFAQD